jgi:hypothetical protein
LADYQYGTEAQTGTIRPYHYYHHHHHHHHYRPSQSLNTKTNPDECSPSTSSNNSTGTISGGAAVIWLRPTAYNSIKSLWQDPYVWAPVAVDASLTPDQTSFIVMEDDTNNNNNDSVIENNSSSALDHRDGKAIDIPSISAPVSLPSGKDESQKLAYPVQIPPQSGEEEAVKKICELQREFIPVVAKPKEVENEKQEFLVNKKLPTPVDVRMTSQKPEDYTSSLSLFQPVHPPAQHRRERGRRQNRRRRREESYIGKLYIHTKREERQPEVVSSAKSIRAILLRIGNEREK